MQQTPAELQLGQSVYAADSKSKNMPGASGYQTIEFAGKFAGQAN